MGHKFNVTPARGSTGHIYLAKSGLTSVGQPPSDYAGPERVKSKFLISVVRPEIDAFPDIFHCKGYYKIKKTKKD